MNFKQKTQILINQSVRNKYFTFIQNKYLVTASLRGKTMFFLKREAVICCCKLKLNQIIAIS